MTDIVSVVRAEAPDRPFRHALTVSTRMPAHATASGHVLMAALPSTSLVPRLAAPLQRYTPHTITEPAALLRALAECREAGFAVLEGELEEGFSSAAVPLIDSAGRLVAALATSSHTARRDAATLRTRRRVRCWRYWSDRQDEQGVDWRVIADTLFRLPLTFWTGFLLASAGRQAFRLTKGRRRSSFLGADRAHLGDVGLEHHGSWRF